MKADHDQVVAGVSSEELLRDQIRNLESVRTPAQSRVGPKVGVVIVLVLLTIALVAGVLAPHDPLATDTSGRLAPIGTPGHVLGTDAQGRDMLSRLLHGTRPALMVTFFPVALAMVIGVVLGSLAALTGALGRVLIMRSMDVLFGLPPVMLTILVSVTLGPGLRNMVISLALVLVPAMTRVAYQSVLAVTSLPFVDAAITTGARRSNIVLRQVIPNIAGSVVAYGASVAGMMVVLGAGLSFLGIGIQPPQPDWGTTINEGQNVLAIAPHVATVPGIAVLVLALGCNLMADGVRDALDPSLRY